MMLGWRGQERTGGGAFMDQLEENSVHQRNQEAMSDGVAIFRGLE